MKLVLLCTETFDSSPIRGALESESIEERVITSTADLRIGSDEAGVFILDAPGREVFRRDILSSFVDAGGAIIWTGAEDESDIPAAIPDNLVTAFLRQPTSARRLLISIRAAYQTALARAETNLARAETTDRAREIKELTSIGVALTTERDYNTLLGLILSQARRITGSDAGSLYVAEELENGANRLRFKLAQNHSRPDIPFVEFTIPMNHASIAGYVASTHKPLVIDDAYFLAPDVEYGFNKSIDENYGYRTKSMMTIPMADHKDEIIGVLQLINRKHDFEAHLETMDDFENQVTPFSPRTVEMVSALAGQAAVSIENSQLYESIETLFEGFVTAAVTAIEQRDPTTSGHSGRVAGMTVGLAEAVDRVGAGKYRSVSFSRSEIKEIRYAGLLHDFGKVGVREQVLVKSKKLYEPDLALIKQRYAFIKRSAEADFYRKRLEFLEADREDYDGFVAQLTKEFEGNVADLDRFVKLVTESNEPTILPEGNFDDLTKFANYHYDDIDGEQLPYLTDDEARYLTIRKGSLDETERSEIESHVSHTYKFLLQIPWTKELKDIPMIAYGHHEKLNGRGYPRSVDAVDIPIQTRMMTIADIFDALTAADRPYKRAMPTERALDILADEVKGEMLDPDLYNVFVEAKAFEKKEARASGILEGPTL